ncbi:hypothetical protein MVES1_000214 [Malassezia vespertilionis]|uniref:Taf10p n=1 Tax=Malassezia vespertilionis TaxID=2020962 RepID=A0A2N1JFX7_9BASI|nr:uncharacterized protein MVES1_000214 [Malassezia vespertilionis]PKI85464.1 Taf10p [Malassezia vespertilionis]WFD04889.1 hypothetical protein MVES1_000214 [Malassezia vespertilionis]
MDTAETERVRGPRSVPLAEDAIQVPDHVKQLYGTATVSSLQLLPVGAIAASATVARALAIARAHHGQSVLVLDNDKMLGYVDMVALVTADAQDAAEEPVQAVYEPFHGTRQDPTYPSTYRLITPETSLGELSVFLQTHPFALITDADRTHVTNVAGAPDLSRYLGNAPRDPGSLGSRTTEEVRRDSALPDLLRMLDTYSPLIPDEVTDFYLERAGFQSQDVRLKRLLALATEKFVADIASDAFQYARIRTNAGPSRSRPGHGSGRDRTRTVLTMDDLSAALGEYGIDARRADSFR